jgi:nucleobase:cation symporter-1, NCS1 family
VSGIVGLVILYLFLHSGAFGNTFEDLMVFIVVWIAPWAGIVLVDFFLIRRGRIDVGSLYCHHSVSGCGDVKWSGMMALVLDVAAAWLCQVGSIESMQGPVAMALGGIDLSWLAGIGVGGGSYCLFHLTRRPVDLTHREDLAEQASIADHRSHST